VALARNSGYKYELVSGSNGECNLFAPEGEKWLRIGRDQPISGKIVVIAHEIGHILDHYTNPISEKEIEHIVADEEGWQRSRSTYEREKAAWSLGKELLKVMGGLSSVAARFESTRKSCLRAYYRMMLSHERKLSADASISS
jgi:hypothetical protein